MKDIRVVDMITSLEDMIARAPARAVEMPVAATPVKKNPLGGVPSLRVQTEEIKEDIHRIAGIEFVAGEVLYTYDNGMEENHRPCIGFRATGHTKRDRKKAMDAAVDRLRANHNGISISVDYPEFKTGLVHLRWQ